MNGISPYETHKSPKLITSTSTWVLHTY